MLNPFHTRICLSFGVISALVGCSAESQNLHVDKFTLRSIKIEKNDAAMVRGDQQKRLYGAVTIAEHKERIGQYYQIRWNLLGQPQPSQLQKKSVQLVFRYQQASTGSEIITRSKTYPLGTRHGEWEFNNIGKDYTTGGRLLAWKAELLYGGKVISTKESYLWSQ